MTDLMTMRMRVGAPPEDVHRALTDAAQLRIWLAEHAEVELPDRYAFWGRFTPEGEAPRQRPLHVDDRTLRFAWPLDGQETTVELKLEPDGEDATVIALSQTHFSREEMLSGQQHARADAHVLGSLARQPGRPHGGPRAHHQGRFHVGRDALRGADRCAGRGGVRLADRR